MRCDRLEGGRKYPLQVLKSDFRLMKYLIRFNGNLLKEIIRTVYHLVHSHPSMNKLTWNKNF